MEASDLSEAAESVKNRIEACTDERSLFHASYSIGKAAQFQDLCESEICFLYLLVKRRKDEFERLDAPLSRVKIESRAEKTESV